MTWLPIATAPKDRELLIWNAEQRRCEVMEFYDAKPFGGTEECWLNHGGEGGIADAGVYSHWMSLPDAPA